MRTWSLAAWQAGLLAFGVMVAAFFVVMISAYQQSLGPLDLASADRLALGLWAAAPAAGGLLARKARAVHLGQAAFGLGTAVGVSVSTFFLFGSGAGPYTCSIDLGGSPRLAGDLLVGGITGAGVGLGFCIAGFFGRGTLTAVAGFAIGAALTLATSLAAKDLFYEGVRCLV